MGKKKKPGLKKKKPRTEYKSRGFPEWWFGCLTGARRGFQPAEPSEEATRNSGTSSLAQSGRRLSRAQSMLCLASSTASSIRGAKVHKSSDAMCQKRTLEARAWPNRKEPMVSGPLRAIDGSQSFRSQLPSFAD